MNNIVRNNAVAEVKKATEARVNVLRQMVALKAAYKDLSRRIENCKIRSWMEGPGIPCILLNPEAAKLGLERVAERNREMCALTDERIGLDLRCEQLMQMKKDADHDLHEAVETVLGLQTGDPVEDLMAGANALAYVETMRARERELANA